MSFGRKMLVVAALATTLLPLRTFAATDAQAPAFVVADFDFVDTSGEAVDQTEAHASRTRNFTRLLRSKLDGMALNPCGKATCTPVTLGPNELVARARASSAEVLIYGGIHKISSLVIYGDIQMLDLKHDRLLLDRVFTFRGDNNEAWARAAEFIAAAVKQTRTPS